MDVKMLDREILRSRPCDHDGNVEICQFERNSIVGRVGVFVVDGRVFDSGSEHLSL